MSWLLNRLAGKTRQRTIVLIQSLKWKIGSERAVHSSLDPSLWLFCGPVAFKVGLQLC